MESETDSIYEKLHEQYETYRSYLKAKQTPIDGKEPDESTILEMETKSKELLEEMQEAVNKKLENVESSDTEFPRLLALKCAVIYEKGRILAQFGDDELSLKNMDEALAASADHRQLSELSYLVLKIYNSRAYLESRSEHYEKAYNTLEEAGAIYHEITNGNVDFYTVDELFSEESVITSKPETKTLLERLATNNLQILSFVCHKLGRIDDYFKFTHEMLERQFNDTENDPVMWAMKVGRLAFGFMTQTRFWEARNHLAAAYHVLNSYGEQVKKEKEGVDTEAASIKSENLKRTEADLGKLWVKYGLYLLSASKKRLISAFYAEANDVVENMWIPKNGASEDAAGDEGSVIATEPSADSEAPSSIEKNKEEVESQQLDEESSSNPEKEKEQKQNEDLNTSETKTGEDDTSSQYKEDDLNEIPQENLLLFATPALGELEEQVTANIVETTEQARAVVTFAHSWLRRSKTHYTISQYPIEYINGILDLSDLYKYLAFFEEDMENQYMVQKSRADALETLNIALRELRPPCLLTITIELLRELAEVQLELVGLNLRRLFSIKGTYDEGDSELNPSEVLQKMGALADLHGRLEHFGDTFEFITQPRFYDGDYEAPQQCT